MKVVGRDVLVTYSDPQAERSVAKFKLSVPRFDANGGDMVFVVGKSGTGKTTLLRSIAGLHCCDANSFVFEPDGPITRLLPQAPQILPWRRVGANLKLPAEVLRRKYDGEQATTCLHALGLSNLERKRPYELSGGMYARVALAQLLVDQPHLLLLDEPTAALDEDSRELCFRVIQNHLQRGAVVIVATHDLTSVSHWASKVYWVREKPGCSSVEEIDLSQLQWVTAGREERGRRLRQFMHSQAVSGDP